MKLVLFLAIILLGCTQSNVLVDSQVYHNEEAGFSIRYPSNWTVEERDAIFFYGPRVDNFTTNVNLLAYEDPNLSMSDAVAITKQGLFTLGFANVMLEKDEFLTIRGNEAYVSQITYQSPAKTNMRSKQYVIKNRDTFFIITLTSSIDSFHEFDPIFEQMIASLTFSTSERVGY